MATPSAAMAPPRRAIDAPDTILRVRNFLQGFSLEATRPKAADVDAITTEAPVGTRVYLSALPNRPLDELAEQAIMIRKAGLEPVPHVAVRNLESREEITRFLGFLQDQVQATHLLVIGGDRGDSAGPFATSLDLIESGLLQRHGIRHVGLAGHPEGHPKVSNDMLDRALRAKVDAAEQSGLTTDIVTQFSFDNDAIVGWIRRLRDYGIENTVRIGLAGPTSLTTLLRYAQRCGVKASAGGLARHAGRMKHLFGVSAPDGLEYSLSDASAHGALGDVAAHFFSFGGIGATARWTAHAAQGRITLDGDSGFSVAP
jgi:methylenetetrahydrofolate reductase (NADPH)